MVVPIFQAHEAGARSRFERASKPEPIAGVPGACGLCVLGVYRVSDGKQTLPRSGSARETGERKLCFFISVRDDCLATPRWRVIAGLHQSQIRVVTPVRLRTGEENLERPPQRANRNNPKIKILLNPLYTKDIAKVNRDKIA